MTKSGDSLINVAFSIFIFLIAGFYYHNILNTNVDYFVAVVAIVSSIILLSSKSTRLLDVAHFLYCIVYLFLVTGFSHNSYLLGLNIVMLITIIVSRAYYKSCILNKKQHDTGFFININDIVKKYFVLWKWDYIFPILLVISTWRFIKLVPV